MAGEELRQTGKVVELKGKLAVVRFQRSDACGHCNACFHFGSNEADIEIDNSCDAGVGDIVAIELHSGYKSILNSPCNCVLCPRRYAVFIYE